MATISGSRGAPASADTAKMEFGASHPYTCNTCQVAFRNSDLQKGHMRSDWHRYNLKRRVASLPPIASEVFTEKVLQARAASTLQEDKAGFQKSCDTCQKAYYSENSYRNHIGSAKHKARLAAVASRSKGKVDDEASSVMSSTLSLGDPAEANSEVDSDAEVEFNEVVESLKKTGIAEPAEPVNRPANPPLSAAGQHKEEHPVSISSSEQPSSSTTPSEATPKPSSTLPGLNTCLFCNYESPTAPLNAVHMERIHGMFIPEKQYLVDPEGLLTALQYRVFELNECLNCGKVKANTFAVQTHMRDKGHCQIPYTTEEEQLEIGEFYDFRSTYTDDYSDSEDESMEDADDVKKPNGAKLGAKRSAKGDGADEKEEDGWETDSSASSLDSDDLHAVPAENHYHQYERLSKHPHHSRDDQRAHHQRDGWHAHNHKRAHAVFYDEYELHLPSGRSVGHRSLNKYYRQNLHSHPSPEERAERLAIEAAQAEGEMELDSDGEERFPGRRHDPTHGRALVNREVRGLGVQGVTDANMGDVKRTLIKGRKKEVAGQKNKDLEVSKIFFKQRHRNPVSYLR
ncbi:C2H2 type zinc-finger-domain-containing protein [Cercophora newfieldiana]|uniref:C2H2 type zinc-finger-domain-containing protein n=1 Tax=Cercophora newfieldiana TaxID=92897 RepID=A0AA40CJ97_9PEZI|nr:C2H2 type zinc-finger-domain-containing protein [Cercophora newfieldiana]